MIAPTAERVEEHRRLLAAVAAAPHPYPEGAHAGRGIVTCAGGPTYLPCAWVMLNRLRRVGCSLPVQLWHLGGDEVDDDAERLLRPLGVECVDGREAARAAGGRVGGGWQLKCLAVMRSRFREVLFLDADNVPVRDPTFIFDAPEYRSTGAVFWPDRGRLSPEAAIWRVAGLAPRDEPEVESGQMVIDKTRCWRALSIALHMNERSDFYYALVHGDKETFHVAWHLAGLPYAMPPHPPRDVDWMALYQHDFGGRILFQHRCGRKWCLDGENPPVPGFHAEAECLAHLAELQRRWSHSRVGRSTPGA